MNLPNKLTTTRLVLAPVIFVWFFAIDFIRGLSPVFYTALLLLLYGVIELTDLLDGQIARKRNLVSDLGKVMDPFGDVLCHLTFFTCFLVSGFMPVWAFMLILWRELAQSFLRMLLMGKGKPMAANIFGKAKTCLYALCSVFGFALKIVESFGSAADNLLSIMVVLSALAAVSSVISFIIYIYNVVKQKSLEGLTR